MDGKDISDSRIGPYNEGQELRLLCESGGGKPIPRVTWYNGSEKISGKTRICLSVNINIRIQIRNKNSIGRYISYRLDQPRNCYEILLTISNGSI